jgi:hypothetical protein
LHVTSTLERPSQHHVGSRASRWSGFSTTAPRALESALRYVFFIRCQKLWLNRSADVFYALCIDLVDKYTMGLVAQAKVLVLRCGSDMDICVLVRRISATRTTPSSLASLKGRRKIVRLLHIQVTINTHQVPHMPRIGNVASWPSNLFGYHHRC